MSASESATFHIPTVVPHAKKTTVHIETLTYKDRHRANQTMTVDEKEKSPRFAFLIISACAHLAHLQSRTSQRTTKALQKSQIFPTHGLWR